MNKFLYNEAYKDLITIKDEISLQSYKNEGYVEVSEDFGNKWIQKEMDQRRIEELKWMLKESDWKVIVNSELINEGLQPKYTNLHQERQVLRNEINELEAKIKDEA